MLEYSICRAKGIPTTQMRRATTTETKTTMVSSSFFAQFVVSLLFVSFGFLALMADGNALMGDDGAVCEPGEFCPNSTLSDCTSCFDCPVSRQDKAVTLLFSKL